jgi:hypothetical protein
VVVVVVLPWLVEVVELVEGVVLRSDLACFLSLLPFYFPLSRILI